MELYVKEAVGTELSRYVGADGRVLELVGRLVGTELVGYVAEKRWILELVGGTVG